MGKNGTYHVWKHTYDSGKVHEQIVYTRSANPSVGDPVDDTGYRHGDIYYNFEGWENGNTVEAVSESARFNYNHPKPGITLKIGQYDSINDQFILYSSITVDRFETTVDELINPVKTISQSASDPYFNVASFFLGDAEANVSCINNYWKRIMYYRWYGAPDGNGSMIANGGYDGPDIYDIGGQRFYGEAKGRTITVIFEWVMM